VSGYGQNGGNDGEQGEPMGWITLDGAVNVRDVGGMPTVDGAKTLDGHLIRSDNLQDLSEADVTLLVDELGVTRVVDLRTDMELDSEGPGPLRATDSVEHLHFSLIRELRGESREEVVRDALLTQPEGEDSGNPEDVAMAQHYLEYLLNRPHEVVGAIRAITESPGAAIVHCAAGKDRTGVVVALSLLVVGVRREAVVADYVATAERIGLILDRLRSKATYTAGLDQLNEDRHKPRAAVMERFLDLVDSELGGPLVWLAENGFGPDDVARLRAKLVSTS
jgi:protein-tyrosine phosphatase